MQEDMERKKKKKKTLNALVVPWSIHQCLNNMIAVTCNPQNGHKSFENRAK